MQGTARCDGPGIRRRCSRRITPSRPIRPPCSPCAPVVLTGTPAPSLYLSPDAVCPRIHQVRPQRELRGRQAAVRRALDGDSLRAPGHAGRPHDHRPGRHAAHPRSPGRHLGGRHQARRLRRHLRGPLLLHRAPADNGLRRRSRRPAAHRPQPQRHRHDDVPDAPAGVHPGAVRRRARPARQPARPRRQAPRDGDGGAHAHPAGAAHDRGALPAGRHRAARTRRRAAAGVVSDDQPQSARRVRDYRHRLCHRPASHQRSAWLRRPDRQHVRQHRDGGLPARERLGRPRCC